MKKIAIQANLGSLLKYVGGQYRSHADALKEHISNALDEHLKAQSDSRAHPACQVTLTLTKSQIQIQYPYGMSGKEFEAALARVADSVKKDLGVSQIGQLGVGMFSFQKSAKVCTFISRKDGKAEPVKITLREGTEKADIQKPQKKEIPVPAGMRVIYKNLKLDPTRSRGPLSPTKLQKVFAEKFDHYLRSGDLKIALNYPRRNVEIKPTKIDLPPLAKEYDNLFVEGNPDRKIKLELYYDPSGKGAVAIRHTGVTIGEDCRDIEAYGLEDSIFTAGEVKGYIDSDFLTPLSSRDGFEENEDWMGFLVELDRIRPSIEAEVELLRRQKEEDKLIKIRKDAIRLAREILDSEPFKDLDLLETAGTKRQQTLLPPHGFDFVPSSVRISPGERGSLSFRALIHETVSDGAEIEFSIDHPLLTIEPQKAKVRASDADENNMIKTAVYIDGNTETEAPAILAATSGRLRAEAKVRVYALTQERRVIIGDKKGGSGINYAESAFEDGAKLHSRLISSVIEINNLNPDFQEAMEGSDQEQLMYAALMIGKETISANDDSGIADEYLERLLSFLFHLKRRLGFSI